MLQFFRKYQRLFFIVITVVIIISFSFFGTFSTFSNYGKKEDRTVALAIDGSPLMLSEVQALSHFISSDREDAFQYGVTPNLCNDGVIRYDLIRTGMADVLAASYFNEIKEDVRVRLEKAKRFKPYEHPAVPFLTAEAVWDQFIPAMKSEFGLIQEEIEASPKAFSRLGRLYGHQGYLTPETLRRILFFHHQRLGMQMDPFLQRGDLSLFGFHSASDWFGPKFLTLSAQFILNAAKAAEKKGFHVSLEEAKADLALQFQLSVERFQEQKIQVPTYLEHLKSLGFDEKRAAEVWRNVLLFRRYFQGMGEAAFVDRLPFRDFSSYVHETATIGQYQFPKELQFQTMDDLIEFETYIGAVCLPKEHPLDLPTSFLPIDVVEKNYPELVQRAFQAKVKEIDLQETALIATVKQVWEWECEEKNWDLLKKTFTALASQGCSKEERFDAIGKLQPDLRAKIDAFARGQLLHAHPEWIDDKLNEKEEKIVTISLSKGGTTLAGIQKPWRFDALFNEALQGVEAAKKELLHYSDCDQVLYSIDAIEEVKGAHILTFKEAKEQNLPALIADRILSAAFPKIRAKSPKKYKNENGGWKLFSEVKEEVAKEVFQGLFDAIAKQESFQAEEYAQYRLYSAAIKAKEDLEKDPLDSKWTFKEKRTFEDQFKFERREFAVERTTQEEWMKDKPFVMMPNEWSPIWAAPNGEISFYYLIDRKPSDSPILENIAFGKELIAADAQKYLAEKLLDQLMKNNSIAFPEEQK